MGERRIDQLAAEATTLADDDVLAVQDVSDGETKKIKAANLRTAMGGAKHNLTATAAPTVNDDETQGYSVGSLWQYTSNPEDPDIGVYYLTLADAGSAQWYKMIPQVTEIPYGLAEPEPIGVTGSPGTGVQVVSQADHVHAHGDLPGGTMHAAAIADGAAGFMSGADKAKLDAVPKNNFDAFGPPTSSDDSAAGYSVGSLWVWPSIYATDAGRVWQCTHAEAGAAVWRRIDNQPVEPIQTSDESITVGRDDHGSVIECISNNPITVTTDPGAPGTTVAFVQGGSGQITVTAGAGSLRHPAAFSPKSAEANSMIVLYWLDATTVLVTGDLEAA